MIIAVRHWLPIVTFCPVNHLPDLVYVTVWFDVEKGTEPPELYAVRRKVRSMLKWRKCFMEELAFHVAALYPEAVAVELRLAFDRHYVRMEL